MEKNKKSPINKAFIIATHLNYYCWRSAIVTVDVGLAGVALMVLAVPAHVRFRERTENVAPYYCSHFDWIGIFAVPTQMKTHLWNLMYYCSD